MNDRLLNSLQDLNERAKEFAFLTGDVARCIADSHSPSTEAIDAMLAINSFIGGREYSRKEVEESINSFIRRKLTEIADEIDQRV